MQRFEQSRVLASRLLRAFPLADKPRKFFLKNLRLARALLDAAREGKEGRLHLADRSVERPLQPLFPRAVVPEANVKRLEARDLLRLLRNARRKRFELFAEPVVLIEKDVDLDLAQLVAEFEVFPRGGALLPERADLPAQFA